jgi:hypothetical protein
MIFIAGPDGKLLGFATEAEADAYQEVRRKARREAEPLLLQQLRKHYRTIVALFLQTEQACAQRPGRSATLAELECKLRGLRNAMSDDIRAAERKVEIELLKSKETARE